MTHDERDRPPEDVETAQRKERVLHTRIPAVLEDELKRAARALRVPVSNLVRTILEDALATAQAVGRVAEEELRGAADRLAEDRRRWKVGAVASGETVGRATAEAAPAEAGPGPLDGVIGCQPLVLLVRSRCSLCGAELAPGEQAYLGLREGEGPKVVLGPECLPGLSTHAREGEPPGDEAPPRGDDR